MSDNLDTSAARDLVEDATRHHGAPWKRVVSSDGGFYGVTDRNGAVVAGSPAVTALIAQVPTLIPELLDRLEQAEQAVRRVRVELGYLPEDFSARIRRALDGGTRRCAECDGTGDVQVRFVHGVQAQDCVSCFGSGESNE